MYFYNGDYVHGCPKFLTLCAWNADASAGHTRLNQRFFVTQQFLLSWHSSRVIDGVSNPQYFKARCREYGAKMYSYVNNDNFAKHTSLAKLTKEAALWFDPKKMELAYRGIALEYIPHKLQQHDEHIAKLWLPDLSWDASHSQIPTIHYDKVINGTRPMIKCTIAKLFNAWGQMIGPARLLPHGSEHHIYTIPHYAAWIATMIKYCDPQFNQIDKNNHLIDFYNRLNFDTGTEVKPENIRNALLWFIKMALEIPQTDFDKPLFTNKNGIIFDWRKWTCEVMS